MLSIWIPLKASHRICKCTEQTAGQAQLLVLAFVPVKTLGCSQVCLANILYTELNDCPPPPEYFGLVLKKLRRALLTKHTNVMKRRPGINFESDQQFIQDAFT